MYYCGKKEDFGAPGEKLLFLSFCHSAGILTLNTGFCRVTQEIQKCVMRGLSSLWARFLTPPAMSISKERRRATNHKVREGGRGERYLSQFYILLGVDFCSWKSWNETDSEWGLDNCAPEMSALYWALKRPLHRISLGSKKKNPSRNSSHDPGDI